MITDEEMYIETIEMRSIKAVENAKSDQDRWSAELYINKKKVMFQIDTGADCNVMSGETFHKLNVVRLRPSSCTLVT